MVRSEVTTQQYRDQGLFTSQHQQINPGGLNYGLILSPCPFSRRCELLTAGALWCLRWCRDAELLHIRVYDVLFSLS